MGAMADAMVEYCRPLIERTNGSHESVQSAINVGMTFWNLALLDESERKVGIQNLIDSLDLSAADARVFEEEVAVDMIQRHRDMFPGMHSSEYGLNGFGFANRSHAFAAHTKSDPYAGTAPYAPCPCRSGKKYKFCCRVVNG